MANSIPTPKYKKKLIHWFCLFLISIHTLAQENISVKPLPMSSQLPSSSAPRVFQDKEGYVWLGTFDGLCRYDGYRLIIFRSDSKNQNLLQSNEITCIAEDAGNSLLIGTKQGLNILNKATLAITTTDKKELQDVEIKSIHTLKADGSIWVGTTNKLYRYNYDFTTDKKHKNATFPGNINSIYEDHQGNLWMMQWRNGLYRYQPREDKFVRYPPIGSTDNPFRLYQDKDNRYWIGTWGDGLFQFNPEASDSEKYSHIKLFKPESTIAEQQIFSLSQDNKYGYLWLVTSSGLVALQQTAGHAPEPIDISAITKQSTSIFSEITKDAAGNLWVGAYSEGAIIINFDQAAIKNHPIESIKKQIGITTSITALYEAPDGDIWINQNRWGVGIYTPSNGNVVLFNDPNKDQNTHNFIRASFIEGVVNNPGCVWVGSDSEPTIYMLKKNNNNNITLQATIDLNKYVPQAGNPLKTHTDFKGNIWIATQNGLLVKPKLQDSILKVSFALGEITDITNDAYGNIWISSKNSGIYKIPVQSNFPVDVQSIKNYTDKNSNLRSNKTNAIHADGNGKIWIGTREGIIMNLDLVTNELKDVSATFNLIDERIFNITSDEYGHIWISTNKRIVEFNHQNNALKEYAAGENDILVNSLHVNSFHKNNKGEMLYGGNKGITVFTSSEKLSGQSPDIQVRISDVKINNQSVYDGNTNTRFNALNQTLTFYPGDKNIEIDFTSLNFTNPGKIRYAYKLEGMDDDWVYTAKNREFAIYNQLKTGSYTFMVRAKDDNGLWNNHITKLKIYKRPAYYETWWAYLIYTIILGILAQQTYTKIKNRNRLRNELKIAQIEKEKSEELNQTKLKYFTNISHDFLTPLTILSCLIDDAEMTYKGKIIQFDSMRLSINRLRRLLQQVLDFRKVERGNMKLKLSSGDIIQFIKDLCYGNFLPLMKKKNIEFSFNATPPHLMAWFDADKIDKIVFNLLSNAFKYSFENGKVEISLSQHTVDKHSFLSIKIKDEGQGIAEPDLKRIFNRFYTNKINEGGNSNGIGMNLSKDLIEIHQGSIHVESKPMQGSIFYIDIPIDKGYYNSLHSENISFATEDYQDIISAESSINENCVEEQADQAANLENATQILLVEDNEELLQLMKNILSKSYKTATASNGNEAIKIIRELDIDIVISDVMMPNTDGLELCRILKQDVETSHIPIILLTAKNSAQDRIECYNAGADGYITKPFELKVLVARINSFMTYKKARQQKFQSNKEINIEALNYPSSDEEFMQKSILIVEQYLMDSEFDVADFAEKLNLSKSTLYRKIKTITGLSPVEFIRNIRLKHACKILKKQSLHIAEVAYAVGFSDPNYFTLCFKAQFNITPTDYRKSEQN